ncbi:carboxypeptidase regulatory-like domain-containing protein [Parapedobacter koreensis]|uniref:Carboxypeptidase regulatory-like domain-containing protein n=1 Tax=Parapedobacter koreensis TaxID=332977 RepID=A0A1H7JML9_9SPHI|nr:carboxypeptidase regulatory-like domain-containing protein [Parapedobacter koreensis]SEK75811.1 Carboxypeptidase regulatory-like domain-containing protein [Parapedobacter koreensis]
MLKIPFHLLFIGVVLANVAYGQQFPLIGRVKTAAGIAIPGATVTTYSAEGKIRGFATTHNDGQFTLLLPKQSGTKVTVRSIGYREVELTVDDSWFTSEKIEKEFVMEPQAVVLDEVVVERDESEPDSVAIHIDDLGLSETSDLKEILSKLPEFQLDEDGIILYRGRNIDKITVNGRQVFVNQNKMALQSIEKRMIDHLDVINNYQDNFRLSFEDTKETVLNVAAKADFSSILIGDVSAGYGASNKYDANGKALYFSTPINAFFIHNTNNIGGINLEPREINALFSREQVFSDLDKELINGVLSQNQARTRDFRSNTNATVRKETNRYRLQMVAYYLMNNRETSSGTENVSEDGNPLLTTQDRNTNNYRALLHTSSFDYRLKDNSLLDYRLITNVIRDHGHSDRRVTIFDGENSLLMNGLSSSTQPNSHYILNDVGYSHKFSNRWISSIRFGHHLSGIDYPVSLDAGNPTVDGNVQDAGFNMNALAIRANLKFRLNGTFIPWVEYEDKHVREAVTNRSAGNEATLFNRDYSQRRLQLGMAGDRLLDYLNYSANWELLHFSTSRHTGFYFPYRFSISVDKRLERWYAQGSRQYFLNDISTGVTLIRNLTDTHLGADELPHLTNRMDSHSLGYEYMNLFRGVSYGVSVTRQTQYNQVQPNFDRTYENGMRLFTLRAIPHSKDTKLSVTGSKNLFSNNYPIKSDAALSYSFGNSPSYFGQRLADVLHRGPSVRIGLQSLNPSWFNFEVSSRANLYTISINENTFDNQSTINTFAVKARGRGMETKLEFIYQLDFLYGNRFDRKNINLTVEKRSAKVTYGFQGLNLDDFFGLFGNAAYNNYVVYNQGINTIITNDRAIRYAIFYIKYTFN